LHELELFPFSAYGGAVAMKEQRTTSKIELKFNAADGTCVRSSSRRSMIHPSRDQLSEGRMRFPA
jgi:hypothetical protein